MALPSHAPYGFPTGFAFLVRLGFANAAFLELGIVPKRCIQLRVQLSDALLKLLNFLGLECIADDFECAPHASYSDSCVCSGTREARRRARMPRCAKEASADNSFSASSSPSISTSRRALRTSYDLGLPKQRFLSLASCCSTASRSEFRPTLAFSAQRCVSKGTNSSVKPTKTNPFLSL